MNLNEKICYMLEYAGKGIAKPFKNTMNAPALTSSHFVHTNGNRVQILKVIHKERIGLCLCMC